MNKPPILPVLIGTGLGVGFWPYGPGTAGAFLGILIWYALSFFIPYELLTISTLIIIIIFTILGTWSTNKLIPFWGNDPQKIIIDEIVGVWVPLLAASPRTPWIILVSLLLFRIFDIGKPFGIKYFDNQKGAFSVMADDLLAGVYSLLIVIVVKWIV